MSNYSLRTWRFGMTSSGPSGRALGACAALLGGLGLGCTGMPEVDVDVIGLSDLATQTVAESPGPPGARELPKVARRVAGSAGSGSPPYRVGPADELTVVVWGHADLGSMATSDGGPPVSRVEDNGEIFLPFLGGVAVGDKSIREIRSVLTSRLAGVVDDPQVEVQLRACRSKSIAVRGAVEQPGKHYLCADFLTAGDAVAAARGLRQDADPARALLVRGEQRYRLDFRPSAGAGDVLLADGDVVHFPSIEERTVYVFGEVNRQGVLPIPAGGLTLLEALGKAGGPDFVTARSRSILLLRPRQADVVAYQIELGQLLEGPKIPLVDGDRLFIPPTRLTRWNRWWRQAIPFGATQVVRVVD